MHETQQTRPTRSRAAYQAQRRTHAITLYFRSPDEMSRFQEAASEQGYARNFNAWILQMLANATSGAVYPPDYVEGLKKDLDRVRDWLETARDENQDYRAQVKLLQQQRDTLLTLLHGLPDGAEVAARFLAHSANQQQGAMR